MDKLEISKNMGREDGRFNLERYDAGERVFHSNWPVVDGIMHHHNEVYLFNYLVSFSAGTCVWPEPQMAKTYAKIYHPRNFEQGNCKVVVLGPRRAKELNKPEGYAVEINGEIV